jgi:NAD+ synthase (glutamine-hydrolysing)
MTTVLPAILTTTDSQDIMYFPIVRLATCNLSQWALDFKGNKKRILESIETAKLENCKYRLGPELEIPGYGCEDHFYEMDTIKLSWMVLADILEEVKTKYTGMIIDIGMPIIHYGVRYNCRVFLLDDKILLIRPKMFLAEDGNYREGRYFTGWPKEKLEVLEEYVLPSQIQMITGQRTVPFGIGILEGQDGTLAAETCEELFTPESPNIMLGLEGVDIITNGSASHFQVGKYMYRHRLIAGATERNGGIYMYANQLGLDGSRQVYDGNGMIYVNGALKAVGEHLSFKEVEVVIANVNLDDVRTYRAQVVSRNIQSARRSVTLKRVPLPDSFRFAETRIVPREITPMIPTPSFNTIKLTDEDTQTYDISVDDGKREYATGEMAMGISRYVFDYLTRPGFGGFFLPLSGGVDSTSTALFVYCMCETVLKILKGNDQALKTLVAERLKNGPMAWRFDTDLVDSYTKITTIDQMIQELKRPQDLMNIILHTCNMPTKNNTEEIKGYAKKLSDALGSYHMVAPINDAFIAMKTMVDNIEFSVSELNTPEQRDIAKQEAYGQEEQEAMAAMKGGAIKMDIPRYKLTGGDWKENLAIQNIQARLRMVTAYYMSQMLPLHRWNERHITQQDWDSFLQARQAAIDQAIAANTTGTLKDKRQENISYGDAFKSNPVQAKIMANRTRAKDILVLASSNADEALRGFYTKYDASSADLNPIGSFSKKELRIFMLWFMKTHVQEVPEFQIINSILTVVASPELVPTDKSKQGKAAIQDDEVAIGMTYDDLNIFGRLRKTETLGPVSMFLKLCQEKIGKNITVIVPNVKKEEEPKLATYDDLLTKVKVFWSQYHVNRHKMNILTNAIHATNYSPDDNRFDHRPFLLPYFPTSYQFEVMEKLAKQLAAKNTNPPDRRQTRTVNKNEKQKAGGRYKQTRRADKH